MLKHFICVIKHYPLGSYTLCGNIERIYNKHIGNDESEMADMCDYLNKKKPNIFSKFWWNKDFKKFGSVFSYWWNKSILVERKRFLRHIICDLKKEIKELKKK